jgi:RNA polymerase sigma factor (TIGR02999 family)
MPMLADSSKPLPEPPPRGALNEFTRSLNELSRGTAGASAAVWPIVYDELRRLARQYLEDERAGHTLQPTALVHEAYVRLVGDAGADWQSRSHFFGVAARAMRHILIDHARRRHAAKRGGEQVRVLLDESAIFTTPDCDQYVLELDEALEKLARIDAQLAQLVELRFFAGLSFAEAATVLGVAPITAKRLWKMAKGWLHREVSRGV